MITPLNRMIGAKWFLGADKLAKRSGVARKAVAKIMRGEKVGAPHERKLREFLENYHGEI